MALFLAIQSTYDLIELGLFEQDRCIAQKSISKIDASRYLIPTLDTLLKDENKAYTDLLFCAVSQGPGPFTTLRTVIATMNGLAYATKVPLIGVNALEALIYGYDPSKTKNVCALLQAFGGDVYMGLRKADSDVQICVIQASAIGESIASAVKDEFYFIGNGLSLCRDVLQSYGISSAHCITDSLHASLLSVAHCGLLLWQNGDKGLLSIRPLYLKNHPASK